MKNNVSKIERKEKIKKKKVLTTSLINKNTPPNKNISYTNSPPKYMTTLIPKTTFPFCHESNLGRLSSRTKTKERRMLGMSISTLLSQDQNALDVKASDI